MLASGVVGEDAAHRLSGRQERVDAILPGVMLAGRSPPAKDSGRL
jgi:hypothetical protein